MCEPVSLGILAGAAVVGAGASIYTGAKKLSAEKKAAAQAKADADKAYAEQDRANNRANQKKPDVSAIIAATQRQGQAGQSGTMLTGPQGVDNSAFSLGRASLLGG